jgi:hypothetical protein
MQFWYVARLLYNSHVLTNINSIHYRRRDFQLTTIHASESCNLVAYNLQAACGWCQSSIEENWWLEEAQCAGNCTTSTFEATGIPSSVATSSINIPSWALLTNTGPSWDRSAAAVIVSGVNTNPGVNTNLGTAAAAPAVTGGDNGISFSYNPYTYSVNDNPYYFNAYYSAASYLARTHSSA